MLFLWTRFEMSFVRCTAACGDKVLQDSAIKRLFLCIVQIDSILL